MNAVSMRAAVSLAWRIRPVMAVFAALGLAGMTNAACAQGQFDARYTLSMAGISIGKLSWKADIGAAEYSATASGRASGIFSILISGEGVVSVRGILKDGRPQPTSYVSAVTRDDEKTGSRMTIEAGKVRDLVVEEPTPETDRVPITDAHKQNIVDPLTAFLIPAGAGDPMTAATCQRSLAVFDGRRRYDLSLSFRRIDKVKADKGYAGPALVCAMKFNAIAGHRASSPLVKYLSEGRDMEVWFVPVAGTRALAPFKLSVASMLGNMVLQADQFETGPAIAAGKI